jgi:hypothetical protein
MESFVGSKKMLTNYVIIYRRQTRSLQKLTDSCEVKDLTGRSIYETTQCKGNIQVVRKQYSLQSNSEAI